MRQHAVEHAEEQPAGRALEPVALSLRLHAVHDVHPMRRERVVERLQPRRVFLEIAVDEKHPIAAGVGQPGHQRLVMAEVAGEIEDPHVRIADVQTDCGLQRPIRRAVVDEDDLV